MKMAQRSKTNFPKTIFSTKTFVFIFVFAIFTTPTFSQTLNLWPKPRTLTWRSPPQATHLSPLFTIISPHHHIHLTPAVTRYLRLIQSEHHRPLISPAVIVSSSSPPLLSLTLAVNDLTSQLHHGVDESYILMIDGSSGLANLTSETVWGAMRGLETFSQLVWSEIDGETKALMMMMMIPVGVYVCDRPLFAHRGVMLDTSRNYYNVDDILRTIGAMSYNKLNVFHWHITDSHSFPLVLPSEPDLAGKGSYGAEMQYSPEDVYRIVQFGLEHGVRVMPEIDSPGMYDPSGFLY